MAHDPCCSTHGVPMDCARYRRTHFCEVRPCCAADAKLLAAEAEADETSKQKRLKDPELAAEYEASRCDALLAQGDPERTYWAPLYETWPNDYASATSRTSALYRFATRPHYDEEES